MSTALADGLTIGRIARGTLGSIGTFRFDGELLELGGRVEDRNLAHLDPADRAGVLAAIGEQVLGVANPFDTPTVPIRSSEHPAIDGYYTDLRTTVDYDYLGVGHFAWSLSARRHLGRDAAAVELVQVGGFRDNALSISSGGAQPWHAVPADVLDYYSGESGGHAFTATRDSASGPMGFYSYSTTGNNRRVASYTLRPAHWYVGAATISLDGRAVTGRQVTNTDAASNGWVVGNDLVRISAGSTPGLLAVSNTMDGSTWTTLEWRLEFDTDDKVIDALGSFVILRNSPEVCVVRLGASSGSHLHRHIIDITVRRGARAVEVTWRTDGSLDKAIWRDPAGGAESTTGGIRGTSDPRWFARSAQNTTADTTDSGLSLTSAATRFSFTVGRAATATSDGATAHWEQYLGVNEAFQQVVGR